MAAFLKAEPAARLTCEVYNDDPTRVRRVAEELPPVAAIDELSFLLQAIADPVRLRILCALRVSPLCVCELAALLHSALPAVSHHLRVLRNSRVLTARKEGKFVCYHLRDSRVAQLLDQLMPGALAARPPYLEQEI